MSTKLYKGLRTVPMPIEELQEKLLALAEPLAKLSIEKFATYAAVVIPEMPTKIDEAITAKFEKLSQFANHFKVDIGIWARNGRFLVYPAAQPCIYDFLVEQQWLEAYGYWDSTDKPPDISEEEWDARREDWESCTRYNVGLEETMFWITLVSGTTVVWEWWQKARKACDTDGSSK